MGPKPYYWLNAPKKSTCRFQSYCTSCLYKFCTKGGHPELAKLEKDAANRCKTSPKNFVRERSKRRVCDYRQVVYHRKKPFLTTRATFSRTNLTFRCATTPLALSKADATQWCFSPSRRSQTRRISTCSEKQLCPSPTGGADGRTTQTKS